MKLEPVTGISAPGPQAVVSGGPARGVTRKSEPDSPGPPGPAVSKVPARVTIMIILLVSFIRRLIKKSKPDSALGPAFSKIPARVTT